MYKKLVQYIENINKKPEEERIKIMWLLVGLSMIIVIIFWWIGFSAGKPSQTKKDNLSLGVPFPNFEEETKNINEFFKQINSPSALPDSNMQEKLENAAKNYLKEKKLMDAKNIESLKIKIVEQLENNWYLSYEQFYNDIPVNESSISFLLDSSLNVISYESNFDPNIKIDVEKKNSADEAYDSLIESTGRKNLNLQNSSLVIFRNLSEEKTKHYLTWKINVISLYPPYNNYYYFIDAKTGKVISYYSMGAK